MPGEKGRFAPARRAAPWRGVGVHWAGAGRPGGRARVSRSVWGPLLTPHWVFSAQVRTELEHVEGEVES